VIEPDEDAAAIGSGGPFALSAATALMRHTKLSARQISRRGDEDRRQNVHLHQRQHHLRGTGLTW
jgi:hypothetical protein